MPRNNRKGRIMASERNLIESKLIRALVERLLKDDFSPQECWQAANAFESAPFCQKLATVIRAMSEQEHAKPSRAVKNAAVIKKSANASDDALAEDIFSLYKKRKITKQDFIDLIHEISGARFYADPDSTAREVVQDFISLASADDVVALQSRLMPSGGGDPYLKGILRKSY